MLAKKSFVQWVRNPAAFGCVLTASFSGLLALQALAAFAGQTGQTVNPVTPEKSDRTEPAQWVPFAATMFQETITDIPGRLPDKVVIAGPYLRNEQGSTYQRLRLASKTHLPVLTPDIGTLFDRARDLTYIIDYSKRTVEVRHKTSEAESFQRKAPIAREEFQAIHSSDQFLGKHSFEGYECEGYKIRSAKRKNQFNAEVWYAPALNFFPLRAQYRLPHGGQVNVYVGEIQVGRGVGPEYFQIPENFRIIHKEKD